MEQTHEEVASRAFRPHRRPLWIAIFANLALFLGLVVFPYARGQWRAADARERFAEFAACFWGGRASGSPGLELPPGERERYASNVLRGDPEWPARCEPALVAVRPDEVFLLFPGAKQAEQQVRAAVDLVATELDALAEARTGEPGTVPIRPHLAVSRLLATLAALHQVTGAEMMGNAIAFEGIPALPEPARVPLHASADAVVQITAEADGVAAIAMDARGISQIRAAGGRVDIERVARPGLVRGTVDSPSTIWMVWAMAQERCAEDEHRCAYHALGLVPLPEESREPPTPTWYAGHPIGRIDRVLSIDEVSAWLVAAREEPPLAELRRFDLLAVDAQPGAASEGGEPPPVTAAEVVTLDGFAEGDTALVLPGDPPTVVWSTHAEGAARFLARAGIAGEVRTLAEGTGEQPFVFACRDDRGSWLALGSERELRVARLAGIDSRVSAPVRLGLRATVSPENPELDRVKLVCDAERLVVTALREDGTLSALECGPDLRCGAPTRIAAGVARADVVRDGETTIVAWTERPDGAEVHVGTLDGRSATDTVPAACWEIRDAPGFCGTPHLAARNGRILLGTREGSDLLAIESVDAGETWRAMRGIR